MAFIDTGILEPLPLISHKRRHLLAMVGTSIVCTKGEVQIYLMGIASVRA